MVPLPPDPKIRSTLQRRSYKDTSLLGFCRFRRSFMNQ